jgi:hypothetical protein
MGYLILKDPIVTNDLFFSPISTFSIWYPMHFLMSDILISELFEFTGQIKSS